MTDAAAAMLKKVRDYRHVSFAELERAFEDVEGQGSASGELAIEKGLPNLFIWFNASEAFLDAFRELDGLVKYEPCHFLVYLIDGKAFHGVPLAKRPPKNGYSKPHWCPVTLNPA